MTAKDIVYEMQQQIAEVFESQNPELFDVVFEIDGKKLYAHKFRLSLISSTFNSMLSDRWISKNDAIKIESCKYDNFKEFIKFLYSGECQLSDENILTMIDIAEFYQVNSFKKYCDEYLSKITLNMENIFQIIEASNKYSIIQMKKSIQDFISLNFTTFVKCEGFLKADKSVIEEIFTIKSNTAFKQEELFQAVYEWAEYQANIKNELNNENFNKNDAIKNEIKEFLPHFEFKKMEISFF
uniref:BTB domain-containing protein n=1 Tax=Panagrolaimus davidi TaxID=227884 RepID=A0A914PU36_9BILA